MSKISAITACLELELENFKDGNLNNVSKALDQLFNALKPSMIEGAKKEFKKAGVIPFNGGKL